MRVSLDTGPPQFTAPPGSVDEAGFRWRSFVDQLDSLSFPRSGYGGTLEVIGARKSLGSDTQFTRAEATGTFVQSFGEHTFQVGVKLGQRLCSDPLPATRMFQWGGMLQQSGYPTGALLGEDLRFARLMYYQRVARWRLLEGVYAGGSLEVGRMGKPLIPGNHEGTLRSASLLLGVDTPLGPLYLSYGRAAGGYDSVYLFLGRP